MSLQQNCINQFWQHCAPHTLVSTPRESLHCAALRTWITLPSSGCTRWACFPRSVAAATATAGWVCVCVCVAGLVHHLTPRHTHLHIRYPHLGGRSPEAARPDHCSSRPPLSTHTHTRTTRLASNSGYDRECGKHLASECVCVFFRA